MNRYFQMLDGSIVRVRNNSAHLPAFLGSVTNTEVQVVPVDAIVIRRDELPEVTSVSQGGRVQFPDGLQRVGVHDDHRRLALAFLAADEHFREHPPVDEDQVKALADIWLDEFAITEAGRDHAIRRARQLVKRGVRVETP
jgi:hypothetical protein